MPTHVHVSTRFKGLYRDPTDNIAGEQCSLFVHRDSSLHCVDVYTVVLPENLTSLREQFGLLYRTWPATRRDETLILSVELDDAG